MRWGRFEVPAAGPGLDRKRWGRPVMLRALIWDVDGTLAETERDGHRVAFNRAFAETGLPWHWDEATYGALLAVAGGKERLRLWWRQVDPAHADTPATAERIAELHALKTRHYEVLVAAGAVALRPGVARLLQEAREAGVRLAVATTTQPGNVHALLAHALGPAAPGWFDCIAAGDMVARKKPAPDVYQHVLAALGVAPHEALAIEDSAIGVAAARGAGLPVLAVRSVYFRDDDLSGAIAVLDNLEGLPGSPLTLADLRRWHARRAPAPEADPA